MNPGSPGDSKSQEKIRCTSFNPPAPKLRWLLFSALSIVCAILIFGIATHGKGLAIYSDSISYLRLSRRLFAHYDTAIGTTLWPPFYPLFLASARLLGVDPLTGAYPLQFFLFAVMGGLLPFLFYRSGAIRCAPLAFSGVIICLCLFLKNAGELMSDLLFCNLVLLFFILIHRFIRRPSPGLLLALAILANAACAARYIGIALIAWGGLVILFTMLLLKKTLSPSLAWVGSFALLSSLFLIVWILRNHHLDGTFFGPREPSDYTLAPLARDTWLSFIYPFTAGFTPSKKLLGLNLLVLSAIFAVALWVLKGRAGGRQDASHQAAKVTGLMALTWSITYIAFLCHSAWTVRFDEIMPRFLLPIYVFEIFLVILAADRLFAKGFRITTAFIMVYLVSSVLVPAENVYLAPARNYRSNAFFDTVKAFAFPPDALLFSNDFNQLYFYTGLDNRGSLVKPEDTHFNPKFSLRNFPEAQNVYLIWMEPGKDYYITPSDPRLSPRLQMVKKIPGGTIFKVLPRQH